MRTKRKAWLGSALVACAWITASRARADEIGDFEAARAAYVSQNFPLAIQRFEALVGRDLPVLTSRPLVLESRKYLGAAYLFVGRRPDAEHQFELLLADDSTYQIDPVAFPAEVIESFDAVRARVDATRHAQDSERERREQLARQEEASRLLRERERLAALVTLASTETERVQHSRFIALIPFGVGQLQNGHDGAGIAFAISEGALAVGSIVTYVLHESIRSSIQPLPVGATEPPERRDARVAATALRVTNWVVTGLLGTIAVIGIVDAQVRFVPEVATVRPRPLPPELREGLVVEVGPLSARATLHF